MTFVTFVTPTIGRDTIQFTSWSLDAQTDPDWEWAVYGNIAPVPLSGKSNFFSDVRLISSAGERRNAAIRYSKRTDWVAFVDDDDTLDPHYVSLLKETAAEVPDADIIVFRMRYTNGMVLPLKDDPTIRHGNVGISFAAKREVFDEVKFIREDLTNEGAWGNEDIAFLTEAALRGKKIFVSPYVAYNVRPHTLL